MNKTPLAIIIASLLIGVVLAASIVTYIYPNKATVVSATLTQHLDGSPWSNGTMIDWGLVEPDTTYQFDNLTVQNTGTKNLTAYIITPQLPNGWTYTWTANNTFLQPTMKVEAPLILYVHANATPDSVHLWDTHVCGAE